MIFRILVKLGVDSFSSVSVNLRGFLKWSKIAITYVQERSLSSLISEIFSDWNKELLFDTKDQYFSLPVQFWDRNNGLRAKLL